MILHREVCKDTGLHSEYTAEPASPEDACLHGWDERSQRFFRYAIGAKEREFWDPSYKVKHSAGGAQR